ncbi:hypothetical protein KCP71_10975 [Salmonella enterica subsp. enterica]|nr:hypothetical protein KCP71_10975 [Salmonella enterica subsp. enterica]
MLAVFRGVKVFPRFAVGLSRTGKFHWCSVVFSAGCGAYATERRRGV